MLIVRAFAGVNVYIRDHTPGTAADLQVIRDMPAALLEREAALFKQMEASQQALATRYNLTLK
ncbi:MAG: hypothetical protein ABIF71_09295 [Planctomycetota bacterium]